MRLVTFVCSSVYIFHLVVSDPLNITSHQNWKLLDDDVCGVAVTDRIIGGRSADLGQYPWLALIGYGSKAPKPVKQYKFRCGAALINRYYVLTAAHCVATRDFFVDLIRLGEYNTGTVKDCVNNVCAETVQDIKPKHITIHKGYDTPPYKNDIALIQLQKPAEYNGWVAPLCMPRGELLTKNYVGEMAEVAGWGVYNMSVKKPSKQLLTVKIQVREVEQCINAYKKYTSVNEEQLCVSGDVGYDSCTGDSGGPLTKVDFINERPRHYAIGIVSFGPKVCGGAIPAVYTNVASYIEWILNNMKQ